MFLEPRPVTLLKGHSDTEPPTRVQEQQEQASPKEAGREEGTRQYTAAYGHVPHRGWADSQNNEQ